MRNNSPALPYMTTLLALVGSSPGVEVDLGHGSEEHKGQTPLTKSPLLRKDDSLYTLIIT